MPDAHHPQVDRRAWRLLLKVGRAFKPHVLVTLGDFEDFDSVSSHGKNLDRGSRLPDELTAVNAALDDLDALRAAAKMYLAGNHTTRLARFVAEKSPELHALTDVPTLLRLKERGWTFIPYRQSALIGKLYVSHDVDSAGRNAAFKALDLFHHSVLTGHNHRLLYVVEGDAVGGSRVSATLGWLGDVAAIDYMSAAKARKDWALAFGVGHLDRATGVVHLTPVPIVNYSCCVNGKLYREGRRR